jgi:DUF1680 family protein
VERGPVVYCLESVDLPAGADVDTVRLDLGTEPRDRDDAVVVNGHTRPLHDNDWPFTPPVPVEAGEAVEIALYPYHRWARRGPSTMRVWLPAGD